MVQQGPAARGPVQRRPPAQLLARQTEVTQQINSMRSQELALAQTRLANERALIEADLDRRKAQRQYEMQRPLADKGFVAGQGRSATAATTMSQPQRRAEVLRRAQRDRRAAAVEPARPAARRRPPRSTPASTSPAPASTRSTCARRSPGQLTAFSIQVGQSLQPRRAARPDRQRRPQQARRPGRRILSRPRRRRARSRPLEPGGKTYRLKVAQDLSAGPQRRVRGRSPSSSAPSRPTSSAARRCRPS